MKIFFQICFVVIIISFYSCGSENRNKILNADFEEQLVAALDLEFVNSDSVYQDVRTRIFKDTIVGYKSFGFQQDKKGDVVNRNDQNFYFIQSLKDPSRIKDNMIKIPVFGKGYNMSSSMDIDTLKNGCLYFGKFGGSTMIKLCHNSSKEYFGNYENDMFYAMQIFLHGDKTIIRSMNGIYIYNTDQQKLLFKHNFYNHISESVNGAIVGDHFIFRETQEKWSKGDKSKQKIRTVVRSIDLNVLKYRWLIYFDSDALLRDDNIISNESQVVIGGNVINLNNGKLNHAFTDSTTIRSIEQDGGYIGGKNASAHNNSTINKFDSKFLKLWEINHVRYLGIYKNKILGINEDFNKKYLFIINRITGEVENKILCPLEWSSGCQVINGYILINNINLYK